jgi:hypothetical protein
MKFLTYSAIFLSVVFSVSLFAAPKPEVVQRPGNWTLEVKFERPQRIVVPISSDGRAQLFWYSIVNLVNRTGRDVDFFPKADLVTSTFRIIPAYKNVPPQVVDKIKDMYKSKYPFLESIEDVENKILEGEDNAVDILMVWPDFDSKARDISLFITGLSNETAVVNHPYRKDPDTGEPEKIYLRKTLELNYTLKGDTTLRNSMQIEYTGREWVMR